MNLSVIYGLSSENKKYWEKFVNDGKKLHAKTDVENFEDFMSNYAVREKLQELKLIILQLCLKAEGLSKCFKNAGESQSEIARCQENLTKMKDNYSDVFISTNELIKKINELLSADKKKKHKAIKRELQSFNYANIEELMLNIKSGGVEETLCKILKALK